MARLQFNKASLARETKALQTYERFLPSLDLKRRQLMAARAKAVAALRETRDDIEDLREKVRRDLPMLADLEIGLEDLARVSAVEIGTENIVGATLPVLGAVDVNVRDYAPMARPHWVDNTASCLREMFTLALRVQVEERRLVLLEAALAKTTQRMNLFEKALIPRVKNNIKRIRIFLSDSEMAAVVRSKIAKRKRLAGAAR